MQHLSLSVSGREIKVSVNALLTIVYSHDAHPGLQVRLLGGAPGGHRVTPVLSPGRGAKPRNLSGLRFTLLPSTFSPNSHVLLSALSLPVTSFPGTSVSSVLILIAPRSRQLRGSWPLPLHIPMEGVHGRSSFFAFSCCSWGSGSRNTGVVCGSLA